MVKDILFPDRVEQMGLFYSKADKKLMTVNTSENNTSMISSLESREIDYPLDKSKEINVIAPITPENLRLKWSHYSKDVELHDFKNSNIKIYVSDRKIDSEVTKQIFAYVKRNGNVHGVLVVFNPFGNPQTVTSKIDVKFGDAIDSKPITHSCGEIVYFNGVYADSNALDVKLYDDIESHIHLTTKDFKSMEESTTSILLGSVFSDNNAQMSVLLKDVVLGFEPIYINGLELEKIDPYYAKIQLSQLPREVTLSFDKFFIFEKKLEEDKIFFFNGFDFPSPPGRNLTNDIEVYWCPKKKILYVNNTKIFSPRSVQLTVNTENPVLVTDTSHFLVENVGVLESLKITTGGATAILLSKTPTKFINDFYYLETFRPVFEPRTEELYGTKIGDFLTGIGYVINSYVGATSFGFQPETTDFPYINGEYGTLNLVANNKSTRYQMLNDNKVTDTGDFTFNKDTKNGTVRVGLIDRERVGVGVTINYGVKKSYKMDALLNGKSPVNTLDLDIGGRKNYLFVFKEENFKNINVVVRLENTVIHRMKPFDLGLDGDQSRLDYFDVGGLLKLTGDIFGPLLRILLKTLGNILYSPETGSLSSSTKRKDAFEDNEEPTVTRKSRRLAKLRPEIDMV